MSRRSGMLLAVLMALGLGMALALGMSAKMGAWKDTGMDADGNAVATGTAPDAEDRAAESPAIPWQRFTLENGLTLIVHEDHTAPLVAVNIWYHVGSKDEAPGRTGFAHLFEHLMYQGSEHYRGEYFEPFERVGATRMNGTTDNDRTNYFQTVPTEALDLALWMESDRMAHLLGAIDQAALDEQRAVVKNEKRQSENRPYGTVWNHIARLSFPEGHPYQWPVIGSMDDLDAASLADVKDWFRQHYGAANAVLVVAGDVEAEQVRERVDYYFGAAPPGPPQLHQKRWIAPRATSRRAILEDEVPQPRLYLVWNTPSRGEDDADRLDLLAGLLAGNASAALNRELIQERALATRISAFQHSRELAGQFWITADAAPGISLTELETGVLDVLEKLAEHGIPASSVESARTQYRADFLRSLEELGGFGGRADVLAAGMVYTGDPGDYQRALDVIAHTGPDTITDVLQRWLGAGRLSLHVVPRPAFRAGEEQADRSRLPAVAAPADFEFPPIQRAVLDNGLQLVLLQRSGMPLVELSLQVPAGHAHSAGQPGLAGFVAALLDEGSVGRVDEGSVERADDGNIEGADERNVERDAAAISHRLRELGARFHTQVNLDTAELQLVAVGERLDDSVALLAEIALRPAFNDQAVERIRERRLAIIAREHSDPGALAGRLLPGLLFPPSHPYAQPLSGLGEAGVVDMLSRDPIATFYDDHYRPDGSTLIAVGDLDMATLKQLARRHFGAWQGAAQPHPDAAIGQTPPGTGIVYLVHRPGATQTTIRAARLVAGLDDADNPARYRAGLSIANGAFGGSFNARLNLNLREDKGWSYGAYSHYLRHVGPGWLVVSTAVQSDRAGAALDEIHDEWRRLTGSEPVSRAERDRVATRLIRSRSGGLATLGALRNELARQSRLGLPDTHLSEYDDRLREADLEMIRNVAAEAFGDHPDVWLAIGDRDRLRPQLESLPWVRKVVDYQAIDQRAIDQRAMDRQERDQ